jgi:glycosyltransferase involved in cell wall biosynthesis
MNMNDLVSIITPSYNTAKFIAETIDSVRLQTYSNWEMIIVDDCSTDDTDAVVEGYLGDSRLRYFKNEKNSGAAVSRNRALREAKGRWIAFLDSDDLWLPDKLEKQIRFMEEHDYHFSYTNYEEIDEESKPLGVCVTGPKKITKHGMYNYCWPGCLTVMYDREKVGLIQIKDIKKNNDYAMWLEVCKKADCMLLDEELAKYRKRSGSISRHSIKTMIGWHYKLWHEAEGQSTVSAAFNTCRNLGFGLLKKTKHVKNA